MAKLSQIMGKKLRKVIPFFYQDNEGKLIEDKIEIYNPTQKQLEKIHEQYKNKNELTEEDFFYFLLNELTDLEIDMDKDKFVEFMKYYNDVFEAVKLELTEILYEIVLGGYEKIEKLIDMPEDRRIKILALNPELREAYEKQMELLQNIEIKETEEIDEEELKKQKEIEELEKRLKELKGE